MSSELVSMQRSVSPTKRFPSFCQAQMKSGALIATVIAPTGRPVSRFTICAIPVTPPETMLFGNVR